MQVLKRDLTQSYPPSGSATLDLAGKTDDRTYDVLVLFCRRATYCHYRCLAGVKADAYVYRAVSGFDQHWIEAIMYQSTKRKRAVKGKVVLRYKTWRRKVRDDAISGVLEHMPVKQWYYLGNLKEYRLN